MKYVHNLLLFLVFWNIGLFSYKACAFPIWALCTFDYKKPKMGKKNVLVQVWGVDKRCVWVYTGPKILKEGVEPPLHCIPEKNCQPLIGGQDGQK